MSEANDELQHLAPLPWSAGSYAISDDNRRVTLSLAIRLTDKQNVANKRLLEMVVRAVNAHHELVDAIAYVIPLLNAVRLKNNDVATEAALQQAVATLTKARGEQ